MYYYVTFLNKLLPFPNDLIVLSRYGKKNIALLRGTCTFGMQFWGLGGKLHILVGNSIKSQ